MPNLFFLLLRAHHKTHPKKKNKKKKEWKIGGEIAVVLCILCIFLVAAEQEAWCKLLCASSKCLYAQGKVEGFRISNYGSGSLVWECASHISYRKVGKRNVQFEPSPIKFLFLTTFVLMYTRDCFRSLCRNNNWMIVALIGFCFCLCSRCRCCLFSP